eukprot:scaffold2063_cov401-Prasinococcus_capsulatus_cf.AAC.13
MLDEARRDVAEAVTQRVQRLKRMAAIRSQTKTAWVRPLSLRSPPGGIKDFRLILVGPLSTAGESGRDLSGILVAALLGSFSETDIRV